MDKRTTSTKRHRPQVAFLGTGAMGFPMAANLARSGLPLNAWNRTYEKAAPLAEFGAAVLRDAGEAASTAEVIILMLTSGPVVEEVLFDRGVVDAIRGGSTVIDMSSISPDLARDHATRLSNLGIHYIDAPVSGGTKGASDATLAILVGGDREVVEANWGLLELLGNPTHLGEPGSGQTSKLVNQMIVGVSLAGIAEALALGAALGVDLESLIGALEGGFADSRILREHGHRIVRRDFRPGASIAIQTKDLLNALDAASRASMEAPMCSAASLQFQTLVRRGLAALDHSAIFLAYQQTLEEGTSLGRHFT